MASSKVQVEVCAQEASRTMHDDLRGACCAIDELGITLDALEVAILGSGRGQPTECWPDGVAGKCSYAQDAARQVLARAQVLLQEIGE